MHDVFAIWQILEVDTTARQPLSPRFGCCKLGLDLVILDEATGDRVDEEHLAWPQPALPHDPARFDVEHADLAREHNQTVISDEVAPWSQPVTVECRPDQRAIREYQRRRTVPRLHQHRVVFVESLACRVDVCLVLVRLRDHHHHRVRQGTTAEVQKLNHFVERCGVAGAWRVDRKNRTDVSEQFRLELRLPGSHPVAVALHGVDLAVVGDHAERLRERPGRKGVGRVAGVHEGQPGHETLVGEIRVERLELERRNHALVHQGAAGQRWEVRLKFPLCPLAKAEGLALKLHPAGELTLRADPRRAHK